MKTWFRRGLIFALLLALALSPAASGQAGAYPLAVIDNPKAPYQVHLRAKAGTSAESLGLYYSGTEVAVYDTQGDWCKVSILGREGYMQTKFLVDMGIQGEERKSVNVRDARPYGVVDNPNPADRLNLRGRPSESWDAYGKYYNGTEVRILGEYGGWYHVLVEGRSGFMMAKFVDKGQRSETGSIGEAVETAVVNNPKASDRLHLRKEARPEAMSLGKYYNGVTVDVLDYEDDEWALVRVGDAVGFMRREYLAFGSKGSRVDSAVPVLTVSGATNKEPALRETPNDEGAPTGIHPNGMAVEVWGIVEGGWYHVRVEDQVGYMKAKYLK